MKEEGEMGTNDDGSKNVWKKSSLKVLNAAFNVDFFTTFLSLVLS